MQIFVMPASYREPRTDDRESFAPGAATTPPYRIFAIDGERVENYPCTAGGRLQQWVILRDRIRSETVAAAIGPVDIPSLTTHSSVGPK